MHLRPLYLFLIYTSVFLIFPAFSVTIQSSLKLCAKSHPFRNNPQGYASISSLRGLCGHHLLPPLDTYQPWWLDSKPAPPGEEKSPRGRWEEHILRASLPPSPGCTHSHRGLASVLSFPPSKESRSPCHQLGHGGPKVYSLPPLPPPSLSKLQWKCSCHMASTAANLGTSSLIPFVFLI